MRVDIQAKHLRRNTGGNHTYASVLHRELTRSPLVEVGTFGETGGSGRASQLWTEITDGLHGVRSEPGVVLHFTGDTGPIAARSGRPVVTTVHGVASFHVPGVRNGRAESIWRARVRRAAKVSSRLITVSESSADDVARLCDVRREDVTVIHHGLDHDRFRPEASPSSGSPAFDRPYILFVGNLEPRKNVPGIVDAFERSECCASGWELVIAGRPAWDADSSLRAIRSARSGRVTYLGPVDFEQVAPLMRSAHGFVFPSFYEGFGFPPLEAAACGAPVVASRRGALAEVLADSAVFVEPDDPDDIAAGMDRLGDESVREDLSAKGLANARRFTWDQSARRHIDVYSQALGS